MDDGPSVEMLREATDPGQELIGRFGFLDPAAAATWVAEVLAQHWGLDVQRCHRLVISDRNVLAWTEAEGRPQIVKWSAVPARFAHLEDAAGVVAWLDTQGVPVAAPVPASDGRLLVELANPAEGRLAARLPGPGSRFLVGVLPVVAGELLDVDDLRQVDDAGRMLATLHEALARYPGRVRRRGGGPSGQLVHHDVRAANLLHDGTEITAVLDFEELAHAPRVADLARSAVLLGTRYRDWGPTSEAVRSAYLAAYDGQASDPLTSAERRDLDTRIAAILQSFGWT